MRRTPRGDRPPHFWTGWSDETWRRRPPLSVRCETTSFRAAIAIGCASLRSRVSVVRASDLKSPARGA
jgi:hypothetical protein